MTPYDYGNLTALFAPTSVAVIGASGDRSKFGGRVLAYLRDGGYPGHVHAVNARAAEVQGAAAHPSLLAVREPVELAVIAVPADAVEAALTDCAARGVRSAIVFAAGFAETGEDGLRRQRALVEIAHGARMRLLGPNCIGLVNERLRLGASFATLWRDGWSDPGRVSVVSQSGAIASYVYVLLKDRGVGVAHWCSTGNEADVDVAECIRYLAEDDATQVIVAAVAGVRDGPRLLDALELARQLRKPVILHKIGRTAPGRAAARAHSGAEPLDERVFDAAIRQAGALGARDFEHAVDVAAACALGRFPLGRRVGIVAASGGAGIVLADCAVAQGLEVPELAPALRADLERSLPGAVTRNPVDVSAMMQVDHDRIVAPIRQVAEAENIDAVIAFLTSAYRADEPVARLLERMAAHGIYDADKPIVLSLFASKESLAWLYAAGYPAFVEPARAVDVLRALVGFAEAWRRGHRARTQGVKLEPPARLDALGLLDFVDEMGIRAVPTLRVTGADDAVEAAATLGYPVRLRRVAVAPATASGETSSGDAVAAPPTDLPATDPDAVRAACAALPGDGDLLVQKAVARVAAFRFAMRRDPVFGPVVAVGASGGQDDDSVHDAGATWRAGVALRVAPFGRDEARRMLESLRLVPPVPGDAATARCDLEALQDAIVRFAYLSAQMPGLERFVVDPFIVGAPGEGGAAGDVALRLSS